MQLARSYGCKALCIDKNEHVGSVLDEAFAHTDGPCVIEAVVEKEDNVFPMVPSGAAISEIILGPPEIEEVG